MKAKQTVVAGSEKQTLEFAKRFAKTLKPGAVLALCGNLGAGKTTFVKGLAVGLGLKKSDSVKSPTFSLVHSYPTQTPLYHFDLYRLETLKSIRNIGFEDYVNDPSLICCVEWAERAGSLMPAHTLCIRFEVLSPKTRNISVMPWSLNAYEKSK